MPILPICTYPDPVLRQKAKRVKNIDDSVQRLIDDMIETMYNAPGIGLAANQVGRPLSVLVVDIQREESEFGLIVLINPEMVSAQGKTISEEGCLSVPEYFAKVTRHEEVVVRGFNRKGEKVEIAAGGLVAIALQHEMDHLEGKLFIDRINMVAKDIFKRKWKKKLREEREEQQPWVD
ncbi:MAG TPA: peptide deformylase [Syntrophobacteraceae bacterium]|nr:peptide deformylase [Syntrophobacteraceae bacterium]